MKIQEIFCRSILSPSKLPGCDYVINPYIGCTHSCVWCYARFMKGYTGHDNDEWGSFVDVKINAPEVLVKDIRKLNDSIELKDYPTIFFSSVCDPYQPPEAKYQLTRKCLKILSPFSFPVSILTQSKLVTRDIDLFKKFKSLEVGMSFITMDEKATRIFQPTAALPKERIETLKKLHQAGLKTYLHVGPILPIFTDFEKIFKAVSPWVDSVMGETLNTRGENWTNLIKRLSRYYPNLLPEFRKAKFQSSGYLGKVKSDFKKAAQKCKINTLGVYTHGQN
ncbi:radical SAM protein [Patescibacteria group bacterium]|nr:radical SAM protein [Patescibacteria group bacterium]